MHVGSLDLGHVVDPAVLAELCRGRGRCGSYVITVRSGKYEANVLKPLASMGWPIMTNGGRRSTVLGSGP